MSLRKRNAGDKLLLKYIDDFLSLNRQKIYLTHCKKNVDVII